MPTRRIARAVHPEAVGRAGLDALGEAAPEPVAAGFEGHAPELGGEVIAAIEAGLGRNRVW
jgi:hypothetical protein